MPTYEYECTSCHFRFEKLQSITADPISICPECEGPVRRLISAGAGIIFKGSGFYTTDYKSSSTSSGTNGAKSKTDSSNDKSSDKKTDTGSDTKKETRQETKTETKT
ncbi:MAG: zinc ribbon domain-containing protein, partial [Spirochaetales bacterium]|nr:zinc ribbon domain-containing protein [Spirochaetales bacterium]